MQCPCHDAKNDEVNAKVEGNERTNEDVVRIKSDGTLYTGGWGMKISKVQGALG